MTYRLVVALRVLGKDVPEFHPGSSAHLFKLQSWIDNNPDWARVRTVIAGKRRSRGSRASVGISPSIVAAIFKEILVWVYILHLIPVI